MAFSSEDKALIEKLCPAQKIRFTEDTEGIFEDKLQKERTGHFTEQDSVKTKQRPQARERQTEARAYTIERERCGWTGESAKRGRPNTNTSFNTPESRQTDLTQWTDHSPRSWFEVSFQFSIFNLKSTCCLLLPVFLAFTFHKVV